MNTYGYARVSTSEQCIDRQTDALKKAGVQEKFIFIDHWSGADFNRPAYARLLEALAPGDLLLILSIDRLGRNYQEIMQEWRKLREVMQVDIQILDMPILNTKREDSLISRLISDIVLQLLSYVAQTERDFLLERQKQGIEAAQKRGVRFGRPPCAVPLAFRELKEQWLSKQISARTAARQLRVSHMTFLRWVKDDEAAEELAAGSVSEELQRRGPCG